MANRWIITRILLLSLLFTGTLQAAENPPGDGFMEAAQKNMSYFSDCYKRARAGESLDAALRANKIIVIKPEEYGNYDDATLDLNILRQGLCEYAFTSVRQGLPDSMSSVALLYRRDAMCAVARTLLQNARTVFEGFNDDYGRYPKSLKEAKVTPQYGIELRLSVDKKGSRYEVSATHPDCDKVYSVKSTSPYDVVEKPK
jgi:hypothetical protein